MSVLLAVLLLTQQIGTPAYLTESPITDWLALATPDGRWAVQLADDCEVIQPDTNVLVIGSPDDPDVQLVTEGGEACDLAQHVKMSDVPCVQNPRFGVCDVWYAR
jgi:hypothetical protein